MSIPEAYSCQKSRNFLNLYNYTVAYNKHLNYWCIFKLQFSEVFRVQANGVYVTEPYL